MRVIYFVVLRSISIPLKRGWQQLACIYNRRLDRSNHGSASSRLWSFRYCLTHSFRVCRGPGTLLPATIILSIVAIQPEDQQKRRPVQYLKTNKCQDRHTLSKRNSIDIIYFHVVYLKGALWQRARVFAWNARGPGFGSRCRRKVFQVHEFHTPLQLELTQY